MKIFADLVIEGSAVQMEDAIQRLQHQAAPGWHRLVESEQRMARSVPDRRTLCFGRDASEDFPASAVVLMSEGPTRLEVVNILPEEAGQLTYDQYNAILADFEARIVRPATEGLGIRVTAGPTAVGLEDWLEPETINRLRAFSAGANKHTGSTHPSDKKRWIEFLIRAHTTRSKLDAVDLARWLVEEEKWPVDSANDLAIQYEQGREILDAYDRGAGDA